MVKRFYVYELVDPRDAKVFYVGKGTKARMHQHLRDALRGVKGKKCERIRDIVAAGEQPAPRIVAWFDNEHDAYRFEEVLIAAHGLVALTNITPRQMFPPEGGSPGRPKGSRNRSTKVAEAMWTAARAGELDELVALARKHPVVFVSKVLARIC